MQPSYSSKHRCPKYAELGNNSYYHSFATLSTISSLAVAPMLPIWRLTPTEYYERHREHHTLLHADDEDPDHGVIAISMCTNLQKRQVKAAQKRARTVLSAVLLLQARDLFCAVRILSVNDDFIVFRLCRNGRGASSSLCPRSTAKKCAVEVQHSSCSWPHFR